MICVQGIRSTIFSKKKGRGNSICLGKGVGEGSNVDLRKKIDVKGFCLFSRGLHMSSHHGTAIAQS